MTTLLWETVTKNASQKTKSLIKIPTKEKTSDKNTPTKNSQQLSTHAPCTRQLKKNTKMIENFIIKFIQLFCIYSVNIFVRLNVNVLKLIQKIYQCMKKITNLKKIPFYCCYCKIFHHQYHNLDLNHISDIFVLQIM